MIARSEVSSFELPRRAEIEDAANRFHKLLTANQPLPGETLEQRKAGKVDDVILGQLRTAIEGFTSDQVFAFLVAYEPVWAIGTGVTATPDDASAAHASLRRLLKEQLGPEGVDVPILYGGSVKPDNSESLLAAENVDGLLIGGASLDPEGFATICRRANL